MDRILPSRSAPPGLRTAPPLPLEYAPVLDGTNVAPVPAPPSPALMRMLTALAAHATPRQPLELMTLLRPPYHTSDHPHGSPTNVHSLGMAADLAAYAGHRIRLDAPEECVAMTLALLRDLPPGIYRIGMPKAPELPAVVGFPHWTPALLTALAASLCCVPLTATPGLTGWGVALASGDGLTPRPWPFFPPQEFEIVDGGVALLRREGKIVRDLAAVRCRT